jgi:hypothetical protein
MILCGVLHVAYQTAETTSGDFMVCVLFNRYMLFAKGSDDLRRLEAVACVYLANVKIDVLQNGQGECSIGDTAEYRPNVRIRAVLLRMYVLMEAQIPRSKRELRIRSQCIIGSGRKAMEHRNSQGIRRLG